MLDKFKKLFTEGVDIFQEEVKKIKNKDFLEAVMAGCALVSAADGTVSADEKQKMIGFIKQNDALKVYNIDDAIKIFRSYTDKFEFDFGIGKGEALQAIAKLKKHPDQARLMIRVCCVIGAADGNFDDAEKKVVVDICNEVGVSKDDFGLSEK